MAKAKVKTIYENRIKISEKEEVVFELRRWESKYETIYELEICRVRTVYESSVLPIFNQYEFKTIDRVFVNASSDGTAINKTVEIYQTYEKENENG